MRRNLIAIAAFSMLAACASNASMRLDSAADVEPASQAGIIEALGGGLFGRIDGIAAARAERMLALEAEYRALEHTPAGQPIPWKSERAGMSGEVVAAQPYRVGSQDCRTYTHMVRTNGNILSARGTACRNADGSWTPLT